MKLLITIALLLLSSTSITVYACSCATGDPAYEFNDAKMVFIGKLLSGTDKLTVKDDAGKPSTIYAGKLRFSMEEVFKGTTAEDVTIEVASMDGTSCGPYGLKRGERYLVYAYGDKEGKSLHSGVCTRTTTVSSKYAKEDFDFLRNLPPPGTGGELRGVIWADLKAARTTPLENVSVKIQDESGQLINVLTDKKGEFVIKQLKPGKYIIEPILPLHYTSKEKTAVVNVEDRGTATVAFEAHMNGIVSGRMFDQDGIGFNDSFLIMIDGSKEVFGHATGEDGGFRIEGAPPGEYRIFIDLQHKDYKNNKRYYYPGTFDIEKATTVKLGLGEKVDGLEFRLPKEFKVRTVEGQVTWKEGTPAAKVEVHLLCPRSSDENGFAVEFSPNSVTTDEQGRFRIEGLSSETYWLEARGGRANAKGEQIRMYSPGLRISLEKSLEDIKVVLSKEGFGLGCPG